MSLKAKSTESTDRLPSCTDCRRHLHDDYILSFYFFQVQNAEFIKFMFLKKIEIQILLLTYRLRDAMIQEKYQ